MTLDGSAVLIELMTSSLGGSQKLGLIGEISLLWYSLIKQLTKYHYKEFYVGRNRNNQNCTLPPPYLILELEPMKWQALSYVFLIHTSDQESREPSVSY